MDKQGDWDSDDEERLEKRTIRIRALSIALISIVMILGSGSYLATRAANHAISEALCANEIVAREAQPGSAQYEWIVFRRNCGATTDYSYHLSIIGQGTQLSNESGNVYRSGGAFNASWSDNRTIHITGSSYKESKKETKFKGIRVVYSSI
ncbi:hypothetical protein FE784_00195 [Paenibacillus hemerocallicola]|uniref:Uncharacterized protein n=1 Tax=Paenibacillus hemerocallicola TaxID=1172614 RepID=A0A5C4THA0_9BACL|nr:hypothetical protein [Paenibacillus hemerocallicola]TNJ68122.1 hypothetical protein FE784_00195 [Paenibacillus hemerocallicola]